MMQFTNLKGPYAAILRLTTSNPQQALQQAQGLPEEGDSPRERALRTYAEACCQIAYERFAAAEPMLDQVSKYFASEGDAEMEAYCAHARNLCALFTTEPTATAPWEALIHEYQLQGLAKASIFAAVALGRARYHVRAIGMVRETIDQWLPAAQQADVPFAEGSLIRLRGVVAQTEGEFARAEADFTHAIAIFERGNCLIEAAHCLIDLAWNRLLQGDLEQAATWLEDAKATFTYHDLPLRRAVCALNESIVFLHQGKFAAALYSSHEGRSLFQQLNRQLDIGSCDMQLGRIYSYIGHWTAAAAQLQRAIGIFDRFSAQGRLASCYYNQAFIRLGNGEEAMALEAASRAEHYARQDQNQEILREIALLKARILILTGQATPVPTLLNAIEDEFAEINNDLGRARCWLEQGWLELEQGRPIEARNWFDRAREPLEAHLIYRWRLLYGLARCDEAMGLAAKAIATYESAIHLIGGVRRQLVNEYLSSFLFLQISDLFEHALACAAFYRQGEAALRITEYQRTLTLQQLLDSPLAGQPESEMDQLQSTLLELLSASAETTTAAMSRLDSCLEQYAEQIWLRRHSVPHDPAGLIDIDLDAVRQRLNAWHGDEWTVVTYLIYKATLYVITQTPEATECHAAPWDPEIEGLIRELGNPSRHRLVYNDIPYLQGDTERQWGQLEDLLTYLLPSEAKHRLHPEHRLYIIPSGVLHMLSWAALRIDGAWLCERAIIQVLPYLAAVLHDRNNPTDSMLQISCGDFGARANPLPMTEHEVEVIAAEWQGVTETLRDTQCHPAQFLAPHSPYSLEKYGVIHIATHTYMNPARGIMGHIMLREGELWLNQLMQLRLNNALVIMSTCNGAVVNPLPGEENISLTSGWLIAGAKAIVATLWPLADGATIPLLKQFYRYVRQDKDVALALTLAQRDCLTDSSQSPIDWGNVVAIGMPMTVVRRGAGGTRPA